MPGTADEEEFLRELSVEVNIEVKNDSHELNG